MIGKALRLVSQAGRGALDLLLPPQCLTCDAPVTQQGAFCPDCFRETGFITDPACVGCGAPFPRRDPHGSGLCHECLADPPPWERARAALRYDRQAQRVILPMKYADRPELAAALAPLMFRAGQRLVRDADLLVPVPMHRRRLIARRYNQAALLARAVARLGGRAVLLDALRRTRMTAPLASLSAAERAIAIDGAIEVRPHRAAALAGRRVLLVDDVLTSGATARACTRALLAAGAAAVDLLVAARVADPHDR